MPLTIKAALLIAVGSGMFILVGCMPPQPVQGRPDGAASPTSEPFSAAETATVTPTSGIPATGATQMPAPSPTPAGAATALEETFDDNRNGWQTDPSRLTVEAGRYNLAIDCPADNVSPECGSFIRMPFSFPSSFRMEMDVTLVKSSPGASLLVGFQVRRSDVHYYFISYSITDGFYQMSYISQTGLVEIVPQTSEDQIRTAAGETKRLGIEIKGRLLTPLINEQALASANNGKIREAGDSYLVILIARGHSAELQFDNLSVQEVK